MLINSLQLTGFRSYLDEEFELSPSITIVVGPNASGKTNLLEALLVACLGKSYRADTLELVHHEAELARIQVSMEQQDRSVVIERTEDERGNERATRKLVVNEKVKARWRHEDNLPVVLFEPEHMLMIGGSPSLRRAYLDDILEATLSGYANVRKRYQRALAQRNNLLKNGHTEQQLFVWDMQLAEYATELVARRGQLVERLNEVLSQTYSKIAGQPAKLTAKYSHQINAKNYQTALLAALHQRRDVDRQRGYTTIGPHRDDLEIMLNDQPAQTTASRGEARSIVLSLKLAEVAIVDEAFQTTPLLLLDDVFSELDTTRQKALAKALKGRQTILTTTNADTWVQFKNKHFELIRLGRKPAVRS